MVERLHSTFSPVGARQQHAFPLSLGAILTSCLANELRLVRNSITVTTGLGESKVIVNFIFTIMVAVLSVFRIQVHVRYQQQML